MLRMDMKQISQVKDTISAYSQIPDSSTQQVNNEISEKPKGNREIKSEIKTNSAKELE